MILVKLVSITSIAGIKDIKVRIKRIRSDPLSSPLPDSKFTEKDELGASALSSSSKSFDIEEVIASAKSSAFCNPDACVFMGVKYNNMPAVISRHKPITILKDTL